MKAADLVKFADLMRLHATPVARRSPAHGPRHWRDVARIGHLIALAEPESDPIGTFLFAASHDTQRANEYSDAEHGPKAAEMVVHAHKAGLLESVEKPTLLEVHYACINHDKGGITVDPIGGACFDADRLTLPRVGKIPSVEYMSTVAVRENFEPWCEVARGIVYGDDRSWEEIAAAHESGEPLDAGVQSVG